jgi:uncharacterized protein (TIGR02145 family)
MKQSMIIGNSSGKMTKQPNLGQKLFACRLIEKSNRMKSIIAAVAMINILLCCGCSDENTPPPPSVKPVASGTFVDPRDGFNYDWVRFNGLDWTVQNSHFQTSENSYGVYVLDQAIGETSEETTAKTVLKYGYLYTYEGALEAAPEGWRIPTDSDWTKLEEALGTSAEDAAKADWRGQYAGMLMTQGKEGTGLSFQYSGYWTATTSSYGSAYRLMGAYGFYWTATEDSSKGKEFSYYRKIMYNSPQVFRYSCDKKNMLSVRFVRDASN